MKGACSGQDRGGLAKGNEMKYLFLRFFLRKITKIIFFVLKINNILLLFSQEKITAPQANFFAL